MFNWKAFQKIKMIEIRVTANISFEIDYILLALVFVSCSHFPLIVDHPEEKKLLTLQRHSDVFGHCQHTKLKEIYIKISYVYMLYTIIHNSVCACTHHAQI